MSARRCRDPPSEYPQPPPAAPLRPVDRRRLFADFVRKGAKTAAGESDARARKETILQIVELLKTNRELLHLFYGLLPPWVFVRPGEGGRAVTPMSTD